MPTPEQKWRHGEWMLNAIVEKQKAERKMKRRDPFQMFSEDDYDIRKRGDHWESYNTITGESLFEAMTYEEARADLREEFGS